MLLDVIQVGYQSGVMSVLTVPILPQPIGNICNVDLSLFENMKTHIANEHQIQWANWLPQQSQCQALGEKT